MRYFKLTAVEATSWRRWTVSTADKAKLPVFADVFYQSLASQRYIAISVKLLLLSKFLVRMFRLHFDYI